MNAGVMHAVRPSNTNGSGKQRVLLVDDESKFRKQAKYESHQRHRGKPYRPDEQK